MNRIQQYHPYKRFFISDNVILVFKREITKSALSLPYSLLWSNFADSKDNVCRFTKFEFNLRLKLLERIKFLYAIFHAKGFSFHITIDNVFFYSNCKRCNIFDVHGWKIHFFGGNLFHFRDKKNIIAWTRECAKINNYVTLMRW